MVKRQEQKGGKHIRIHLYTYGQLRIVNSPNFQDSGRKPGNVTSDKANIQAPVRQGLALITGLSCCEATGLTTINVTLLKFFFTIEDWDHPLFACRLL